jgi:hypothetical protein
MGMTANDIRSKYLEFFKKRGHAVIPSAPLVPENDPTTLFNSSGMQPLVSYLLGTPHPLGKRLVDSQKAFRSQDIEEVGDNRHTTFFEMLGNWSLGEYFKKEQLPWCFEFMTSVLGLDPKCLYVSVFEGNASVPRDNVSINLWKEIFSQAGIDAKIGERIFIYPATKNWWSENPEARIVRYFLILEKSYIFMSVLFGKTNHVIQIVIAEDLWKLETPFLCNIKNWKTGVSRNFHNKMWILVVDWNVSMLQ